MPKELDLKNLEELVKPSEEKPSVDSGVEAKPEKIPAPGPKPEKEPSERAISQEGAGVEGTASAPAIIQAQHSQREKQIEKVLAQDLEEAYLNMPPAKQKEFKVKGEKTAQKINALLDKTKVKAKKIISLIKKWLSLIPGINKFFLEQETKIKVDEIMKMKDR
ncbi:hypothetical protein COV49_03955 [Candidatus Falkowbacteria bacterium CG11_big_fil_rev_8_21_14_0_20_39_10]|uniref:Uncharacterized protein n=1 Tax=Candidatus Falkowbacteria bacterium CG11_big_fil_rev_8_21_14_0_20_39_10 TaxID=1974570 RepID=A0A2M6K884_9BACT|nr:MAG: hypothetical protein COV49_03955 [Candidatus Falkowbacteria bacterium CG11_big_fil_rev_8_21_14_0_20_39_10]